MKKKRAKKFIFPSPLYQKLSEVASGSGKLISALYWATQVWPFVQDDLCNASTQVRTMVHCTLPLTRIAMFVCSFPNLPFSFLEMELSHKDAKRTTLTKTISFF